MTHLYSVEEVLAYTPEELDAYLATKEWGCDSLGDKRQAVLVFLNQDGLLNPQARAYVEDPSFALTIHLASVDFGRPDRYAPILCLAHSTRDFAGILQAGQIVPNVQDPLVRNAHFPGVYMTAHVKTPLLTTWGQSIARPDHAVTLVFSPTLMDRGDWHLNLMESFGYIGPGTISAGSLELLPKVEWPLEGPEVVFHHPVRIDATERLIGIWVPGDTSKVIALLNAYQRQDLIPLVSTHRGTFTADMVRDHAWPPMKLMPANFCTPFVSPPRRVGERVNVWSQVVRDCGISQAGLEGLLIHHCRNDTECAKLLENRVKLYANSIQEGRSPAPTKTPYYPPFTTDPIPGSAVRGTRRR